MELFPFWDANKGCRTEVPIKPNIKSGDIPFEEQGDRRKFVDDAVEQSHNNQVELPEIGIVISEIDGKKIVVKVLDESIAACVQPGDEIYSVNDRGVRKMSLEQVAIVCNEKRSSAVTLGIRSVSLREEIEVRVSPIKSHPTRTTMMMMASSIINSNNNFVIGSPYSYYSNNTSLSSSSRSSPMIVQSPNVEKIIGSENINGVIWSPEALDWKLRNEQQQQQ